MRLVVPPKLLAPGRVKIIAPSSSFDAGRFEKGLETLSQRGYKISYSKQLVHQTGYLCGSDHRRHRELLEALGDKRSQAIFFARGGYGLTRIMPQLIQTAPRQIPAKIWMGLSDLTPLLNWLAFSKGLQTVHGPVLAGYQFSQLSQKCRARVFSLLEAEVPQILEKNKDFEVFQSGEAHAPLSGGNLAMIEASLGTPYAIPSQGKVIFLEEVSEPAYRIDRMIQHLGQVGFFQDIQGLLIGDFNDPKGAFHANDWLFKLLKPFLPKHIPVMMGLRSGHVHADILWPLGATVHLDTRKGQLCLPPLVRG